jgi:pyridoxal phosphate enzyme (YggS family)
MSLIPEDADRIHQVKDRIARAAERVGRDPGTVQLVAVSKTFPPERVVDLAEAGLHVFGENRVQETLGKRPRVEELLPGAALCWRLIGHLQRNKARQAVALFDTIDSVDSLRLLTTLDREAGLAGKVLPVLLQFNCSGEPQKSGFDPGDWEEVGERVPEAKEISVQGVLTVARHGRDPAEAREDFVRLRDIRERLEGTWGRTLPDLSMGMSHDLEIAVEEGATQVRVGSALFGPRS